VTSVRSAVLDAAVIGPMRHQPGRTALAILAIALGIALGLSIYLINRTAADEVSIAARSLYGLADLAVEALGQSFDESLYPQIARTTGVAAASPELEIEAKLVDRRGSITLIGVDGFRYQALQPAFAQGARTGEKRATDRLDPNSLMLSASAANELGLVAGETLDVQIGTSIHTFKVAAVLPSAALRQQAGLIDIATAQWKFNRLGELSRVSLRLKGGAGADDVRQRLEALGTQIRLTTPGESGDDALRLSRAYRANLTALALVALFTGTFFVYSTQSLAALRRRREFAILHALGLTRRQQLMMLLLGSAATGLLGSIVGIVLGIALANTGLRMFGEQVGAGYFELGPQLSIRVVEIAAFCSLGIVVAVAGAVRPAIEASRIPTASALKAGDVASAQVPAHRGLIAALFVLSAAILFLPPIADLPLPGYVSIALLLIATVLAMPLAIRSMLRFLPNSTRAPYEIAIAELSGTARYAALSVSAIVVSFSLMVAMAIMVTSFRASLDSWTQKILPADLYLRVGYPGQSSYLDEGWLQELRALPGIERIETSRFAEAVITAQRAEVVLIARSFDAAAIDESLWITQSASGPVPAGVTPIWVSEAVADLFAVRVGEPLELQVRDRAINAYVQGVWRDYEHQGGAVIMTWKDYFAITGDRNINTVWMWLDGKVTAESVRTALRETLPVGIQYDLREPRELRELSLEVFDRTFAITYLLEIVAVGIGLFGIAAGISAQVLARRGELGALRHLGFTRGQIGEMLAIEGGVLGTFGVLVGLATGGIVSLILIYVVNRQSFHWSMDLHAPYGLLLTLSLGLIVSAALIAVLSGRRAMSTDVVRAVKEDW
jgi:putative ABC transport system permease protein